MSVRYYFDTLPPTPNQFYRMHWTKRRDCKTELMQELMNQHREKAVEPCEIEVLWRVYRVMDEDNMIGRLKPVLDAFVTMGILSDDNPNVIKKIVAKQTKCRLDEQRFELEIREYLPFGELEPA